MGKPSTTMKNQWNKERYKQVKVCVPKEVAIAFKVTCEAKNVSMASELIYFMQMHCGISEIKNPKKHSFATRSERRKTLNEIIKQIIEVKDAEESYQDAIPDNLKNSIRYDATENTISIIEEAIELLSDAF